MWQGLEFSSAVDMISNKFYVLKFAINSCVEKRQRFEKLHKELNVTNIRNGNLTPHYAKVKQVICPCSEMFLGKLLL